MDTASANLDDVRELETMLEDVHFFEEAAQPNLDAVGADLMQWDITVNDEGRQHSVRFTDDGSAGIQAWKSIVEKVRSLQ